MVDIFKKTDSPTSIIWFFLLGVIFPIITFIIIIIIVINVIILSEAISSTLADTYQRLYELPEPKLPVKYPRTPGYRPSPEDNPYNAW